MDSNIRLRYGLILSAVVGYFLGIGTVYIHNAVKDANPEVQATKIPKLSFVDTPTPSPTANPDPHSEFTYDNLLIRLNEARLAHGLPQLGTDSYLSSEAQKDLIGDCPATGHENFRNEFDKGAFKNYSQVAEAVDSGDVTPLAAIGSLLASPTHADAIIGTTDHWDRVGIGVLTSPANCVSFILGKK